MEGGWEPTAAEEEETTTRLPDIGCRDTSHKWTTQEGINLHTLIFFYKNTFYKNIEPHFLPNLKNILIAQIAIYYEIL